MRNQSRQQYIRLLNRRNLWVFTIMALLLVILGNVLIAYQPGSGLSIQKIRLIYQQHLNIWFFDLLPVCIFTLLTFASRAMNREINRMQEALEATNKTLRLNTSFAKTLSEGDNPDTFPGMLDSELGKSLKLIELNIKSNRRKEKEITWITEGKDMISRILRLHNQLDDLSYNVLKNLYKYIDAIQGAFYIYNYDVDEIRNIATYAYNRRKYVNQVFKVGQGLVGQCAYEMDYIYRTEIPDDYVTITSGILGDQKPKSILLVPLITNDQVQGVIEFAFLSDRIPKLTIQFLLELGEIIARTIYNLRVNEKTRTLLEESREMTEELKKKEQIMHQNAEEMEKTQQKLQITNTELHNKIEEEENARNRLHWLLENASEIISIYDENLRLKYISPSAERILDYRPDEMMMGKDFERIDQAGSIGIRKAFDELLTAPEKTLQIEYSYIRKDGKRLFLSSSIRNLLDDPSIEGFIFNTRDITELKTVEKEQRLKTRMQSLSENSLDLIIRLSKTGMVHYVNPVIEDYAGVAPGSLINKNINESSLMPGLKMIIEKAIHMVGQKPVKYNIIEALKINLGEKEGERTLNFNIIPEFQDNELETILIVGHDITEAKRIEKEIKITNKKIQDSITYAERIQSSILPSIQNIRKALPESFIFYKPKDVISGDFPWFFENEDAWYLAAIDCTGHGVPGALLSFIGFFLLNNITALNPDLNAGQICDILNNEVKKTLKQDRKNPETRDGMDMGLCKIHKKNNTLEFAGAHRPLYLLREGEIISLKGDRKAIGGLVNPRKPEKPFTNHQLSIRKGDKVFIFSDGLTDQLGGEQGDKYTPARVRNILLENKGFTLRQFQNHFEKDFTRWLGNENQIDDVLLIGLAF